jgi:thiol-disulfide isomerase/thioredoxin
MKSSNGAARGDRLRESWGWSVPAEEMTMKTAALVIALAALIVAAPARVELGARAAGFQVGAIVPKDVTLKDIFGKDHTFGEFRGKVVFVHFWSIVCPYEKAAEPKCIDLQKQFGDKVVQIAINANQGEIGGGPPYQSLRDHVQQAGVNFLVTVDPGNKVTDLFGGTNTPHCFVVDPEGVVRYNGALDDDPRASKGAQATPYVKNAVEATLAGKPAEPATTKPYG